MNRPLVVLSIPGLRSQDVDSVPFLARHAATGSQSRIAHSFPCVTWPTQCNVLTGKTAADHGIVANGFFWRDKNEVEMWTAWNEVIQQPQVWDTIKSSHPDIKMAAWFPMLAKGCQADFVCMPAPIHKPDGSEDMWCHTKPQEFYGELLEKLGHFPLQHFWGPLAGIQSSQWIVDSAIACAGKFKPDVWYIYLPHLDYAGQKCGPDSQPAKQALADLGEVLENLENEFQLIYGELAWLAISEYVITDVDHVVYPNRVLRNAGLLVIDEVDGLEQLDYAESQAWALVDHQFSHVFIKDGDRETIRQVVELFEGHQGIQAVAAGQERSVYHLDHPRSGDVILVSSANSWQAYYWWSDDQKAPSYARTVDIHQKPGYDPVELFFDPTTRSIPLNAELVKGSHGAPAVSTAMQGALVCSLPDTLNQPSIADTDLHELILRLATS